MCEVRVEAGVLRGSESADGQVRSFLGVPYAEAPVGQLRWRPPQPRSPWSGARDATSFAPIARQLNPVASSLYAGPDQAQDEDCLYLNVWTGGPPVTSRPVLVWLHFGAFQFGSSSDPRYDGEALARVGLTVVTVNYRLGRFGFLAHPKLTAESEHGASGNYGLLDQVMALDWIRRNIDAFGGDPANVTLAGCSAGAHSIYCHLASPISRGLFHRAIAMSGLGFSHPVTGPGHPSAMQTLRSAEEAGLELSTAVGAQSPRDLRNVPAEAILGAQLPRGAGRWNLAFLPPEITVGDAAFDSGYPVIDGHFLPRAPREVFECGDQHDIPLIVGSTANESSGLPFISSSDTYRTVVQETYGDLAPDVLSLYPADGATAIAAISGQLFADRMFTWASWFAARHHARTASAPIYYYRFEHQPPLPEGVDIAERENAGAFHGSDIPYAFRNLGRIAWPWTAEDDRLSELLSGYWVNFVHTGDPNGRELPGWPAFTTESCQRLMLKLDHTTTAAPTDAERMAFWDRYYARWRGTG